MVINNNLYIVSEQCNESLKSRLQRSVVGHNNITRVQDLYDPLDALNAQTNTERRTTYIVLLIIHDCLRILKFLSLNRPLDSIFFSSDNLLIKDGHVKLSDSYFSRSKLKREYLRLILVGS